MPHQPRLHSPAGLHHVILRGNNRANFLLLVIFSDPSRWRGFVVRRTTFVNQELFWKWKFRQCPIDEHYLKSTVSPRELSRQKHTRQKPGSQSHGSSLPPRSHGRLPEGPKIAGLPQAECLGSRYAQTIQKPDCQDGQTRSGRIGFQRDYSRG